MTELWSDAELDAALADLHADVPTDEHVLSQARAELLAAASAHEEGSPMSATEQKPAVAPHTEARRRRRQRLAAAAAAVAVAGGAVVAVQATTSSPDEPRQPRLTTAAQVLKRAASNVTVAPDEKVADGQFRYLRAHQWGAVARGNEEKAPGRTFVYMTEVFEETWIPADETAEWLSDRDHTEKRKFLVGSEKEMVEAGFNLDRIFHDYRGKARCGGEVEPEDGKCEGAWTAPTQSWAAALPRDPKQMLERIRADADDDGDESLDARALETVAQALERGMATAPADVRSALYEAIAMMPDIEITERVANLDGRKGTAMGVPAREERIDIIVDSDTGEYIGSRRVQADDQYGVKPGTVTGSTAVTTAVVDKAGQRPK